MKINPFLSFIALLLCGLVFYGFFTAADEIVYSITAGVASLFSLIPALGLYFENSSRMSVMFKTTAWSIFFLLLVVNICFVWLLVNPHATIITNGVLLVVELLALYGISRAAQND